MSETSDKTLAVSGRTVGQLPAEHNQTQSGSAKPQRSTLGGFVVGILEEDRHDSGNSKRSAQRCFLQKLCPLLSDARVFLDPLLLYVFVGNDDNEKSIKFDNIFGLTICILNIFLDLVTEVPFRRLLLCRGFPDIRRLLPPLVLSKKGIERLMITFYNVFLHMPSSLVLMILFLVPIPVKVFIIALILVCLRFLKSISRMHEWYRTSRTSAHSYAWFMMFLVFYTAFSNLLGALWYIQAIFKEYSCWDKAWDIERSPATYCSRNATNYDFGLYRDAHQSGILEMTAPKKILYCFRWALQNLSSFGQGLQPAGANILENIFMIIIIFASVFLFSFTIGKVQIFLEYSIKRNETIEKKLQEIEQSLPFQKLSKDLQSEMKNYYKKVWYPTKGHNKKHMFYDLPKDLRQKMIPQLCIDLLIQVGEFRRWNNLNEASFADLCKCVKLISYKEDTNIIRKGDPIDKMIFLLQGELWIYTPADATASGPPINVTCNRRNDLLRDGNFCGQELISWFQAEPYTLNLPVSDRTIQAVTNTDAFVLMAYDLKNIFLHRHEEQIAAVHTANTDQRHPSHELDLIPL